MKPIVCGCSGRKMVRLVHRPRIDRLAASVTAYATSQSGTGYCTGGCA